MPGTVGPLTGGSMGAGASEAGAGALGALGALGAAGGAGAVMEPGSGGFGIVVGTVAFAGEPGCWATAAEAVRRAAEQTMR